MSRKSDETSDAPSLPKPVYTYLEDYSAGGELIAYWTSYGYLSNYAVLTFNPEGTEIRFLLASFPRMVRDWAHQLSTCVYSMEEFQSQRDDLLKGASRDVKDRVADYMKNLEKEKRI